MPLLTEVWLFVVLLTEIYTKNPDLTFKELFNSSFNVVIEVLNSTIYTLLFAFIASNFALVIYLQDLNYSFFRIN